MNNFSTARLFYLIKCSIQASCKYDYLHLEDTIFSIVDQLMFLNSLHEFMHDRNAGQFYAVNSCLQIKRFGSIRMEISPDVNFKSCVAGGSVQRNSFTGKFLCHFKNELSKRLLDFLYVS